MEPEIKDHSSYSILGSVWVFSSFCTSQFYSSHSLCRLAFSASLCTGPLSFFVCSLSSKVPGKLISNTIPKLKMLGIEKLLGSCQPMNGLPLDQVSPLIQSTEASGRGRVTLYKLDFTIGNPSQRRGIWWSRISKSCPLHSHALIFTDCFSSENSRGERGSEEVLACPLKFWHKVSRHCQIFIEQNRKVTM